MKYIRTKKGEIGKLENTEAYIKGKWYSVDEIKDYILAQADSIEELCDEFSYKADNVDHIRCWKSTITRIWRSFGDNIMLNKQEIQTIRGGKKTKARRKKEVNNNDSFSV